MKILLDENLPHRLRNHLPGHDVFTTKYMGWDGLQNGELLAKAASDGFDVLLTLDNGIQYQHNLSSLACAVIIVRAKSNSLANVLVHLQKIQGALATLQPRTLVRIP
jgi:hypothetical protein